MIAFIEEHKNRPFFLYVHTSEPHQPYLASAPFRERFAPDADEIVEIFALFDRFEPARNITIPSPDDLTHR